MSVLSGDYNDFYRHYEPFVASYATRRVDRDDVDDIVAQVFATAWRRRVDVPENALPWLYRTARNTIGNQYRSTARWTTLRSKLQAVPAESSQDPAEVASERSRLIDAMSSLTDEDRELLLLISWEGLSTPEIADVIGISPGTASVRVHRARQRLEQAMSESDIEPTQDNKKSREH